MTSFQYFVNISVKISPNSNKLDSFKIYTERAVEKCPRLNFYVLWRPRNLQNKSVNNILGRPVGFANISVHILPNNKNLDIFKIYMERAIEKCPRWIFQTPRKLLNLMSNIMTFFFKHPVLCCTLRSCAGSLMTGRCRVLNWRSSNGSTQSC